MNSQPILITHPGKPKHKAMHGPSMGRLALVAGIFIMIVGWVDLLVGWFPLGFGSPSPDFGSPAWKFGAVNGTVDRLLLPTLGAVMTLLGASACGSRWGLWTASIWTASVLMVLAVAAALYAPIVQLALRPTGLQGSFGIAVVKTSTLLAVYVCFYGWMELQAIRGLRGRN